MVPLGRFSPRRRHGCLMEGLQSVANKPAPPRQSRWVCLAALGLLADPGGWWMPWAVHSLLLWPLPQSQWLFSPTAAAPRANLETVLQILGTSLTPQLLLDSQLVALMSVAQYCCGMETAAWSGSSSSCNRFVPNAHLPVALTVIWVVLTALGSAPDKVTQALQGV